GFLSENAGFAQIVEEHGLAFIGPTPADIRTMGDKIAAKEMMRRLGVPCVPGSDGGVDTIDEALAAARDIGYPVLIKAAAGGGGRGMKLAPTQGELLEAFRFAQIEAKASFGYDAVYLEKFLPGPRHIEVQIMADGQGNVAHLGERDCSLQRRHQKLVEESPSPGLNPEERDRICRLASEAMSQLGYLSAGTIEFLYQNGEFYFIEMNTRLQVEHPITEAITGIDLVREQIRIAAGLPMSFGQDDITFSGHAIECRINAEDPVTFVPSPGVVTDYHAPGGLGVRVDSGLYSGYRVPAYYDSLIAKLIVHGQTRNECLMRLRRALDEFVIEGVNTTIPLHQRLIGATDFIDGNYDIHWLERYVGNEEGRAQ
ncbi:MAG: ATP-grasp domain-containing protein, partial [Proteobacteria bacterium]|nr:ATP-grasp domain-containing protein [Pseudomonadota bacterium]